MHIFYYFLIGILLFYTDTIIGLTIPMHSGKIDTIFVPHLTIMYILIMTVYRGFGVAMSLAFFLGIVTDLYFGSICGLYMFSYIILVVIVDKFFKIFYRDYSVLFFIILLSTMFLGVYVVMIYGVMGFIKFNLIELVLLRLIPTLIINFLLLVTSFPITTKFTKEVRNTIDGKA